MEMEGLCRSCNHRFDGHWHKGVNIMNPKCPICKSKDVIIWNDEINDKEVLINDYGDDDE